MKFLLQNLILIFIGFLIGISIAWPRITNYKSWKCSFSLIRQDNNINKSKNQLKLYPKYILKRKSYLGLTGKIRIIGDTCFR